MGETKVVYHIGDEDTPYLVYIPLAPEQITLGDFTREINKAVGYRYYFKTLDDDIVVKKEIKDPDVILPCYHGRVVSWIVPCANGKGPSNGVQIENTRTIPPSRPVYDDSDASSVISDDSSIMSSEIESTSVADSDEERPRDSRQRMRRRKRKKAPKPVTRCSSYSSMTESSSSLNIITVTLDMENISYLGMSIYGSSDDSSVPGIYVGKIYKGGAVEADGRISTNDIILTVNDISFENLGNDEAAKILKEIAQKPGPITFVVAKANWDHSQELIGDFGGDYSDADTISIASSTCLDPTAKWIQQQQGTVGGISSDYTNNFNYHQNNYFSTNYSLYSTGSESPSNSQIGGDTIRGYHQPPGPLTSYSNPEDVVRTMSAPNSGLEIKERTWLKVTIPDAFIGQDLVKWLKEHVNGLSDHKDARKFAHTMLKRGYICNTVNKSDKFSDQCYYICGTGNKQAGVDGIKNDMQGLSIDHAAGSQRTSSNYSWSAKPPGSVRSHGSGGTASSSSPRSAPRGLVSAHHPGSSSGASSQPPSYSRMGSNNLPSYHSYMSAKSASQRSGFAPVKHPNVPMTARPLHNPVLGSNLTRTDSISSIASSYSQHSMLSMNRPIGTTPSSVAGSQASFRMAIDNPVEYFSDAV